MLVVGPTRSSVETVDKGGMQSISSYTYIALASHSGAQERTLGACIGTLEPSLVANLDLEDVEVAVADRS